LQLLEAAGVSEGDLKPGVRSFALSVEGVMQRQDSASWCVYHSLKQIKEKADERGQAQWWEPAMPPGRTAVPGSSRVLQPVLRALLQQLPLLLAESLVLQGQSLNDVEAKVQVQAIGCSLNLQARLALRDRPQNVSHMLPPAAAAAGLQALLGPLGRVVQQQLLPEDVAAAAGAEISSTLYFYLDALDTCLGQGGCTSQSRLV
jgi:hypothetical protein